jgi:hypothetical protein
MSELILNEVVAVAPTEAQLKQAAALIRKGPVGRKIVVLRVSANNPFQIKAGDVFQNSRAAATAVGVSENTVFMALRYQRKWKSLTFATVRGVTFQFLSDYQADQPKTV